ncbi:MAG: DUF4124 domain-containing protein [Denitratisoma sp.]|nr:DUF4124 domain-containing protein [Denitratisoma sp.]
MRAITLLILACLATAASAQVYTWRDASGKVHYSDTPPPGVDAKRMRAGVQSDSAQTSGAAGRSLAEQEAEFRKRQAEAEKTRAKAAEERSTAEDNRRNCDDARNQLNALESGQRMSRIDSTGERIPLDDEMRAQEIEKARKSVQSWCK